MAQPFLLYGILAFAAGAVGALMAGRRSTVASRWAAGCTVVGSLLGSVEALRVLLTGRPVGYEWEWAVPGGDIVLALDPLAAFFLLPVFLLAAVCAVYGTAYLSHAGERRRLGPHWVFYCGLVAAMTLVLTAASVLFFLAAWEMMTVTSFFLVAFDHRRGEVGRAAWLYLLACHLGGAFLFALFLLAGQACGGFRFADFGPLAGASPGFALLLFLLALGGFGVKAGLFPLHVWLPEAHPAAPSHVSALMSAVMVKTGIYGILRVLTFLPPPPSWWGGLLAGLGILGALYGISLALLQGDLKRCLAYSTVENVGIIFLGLGLGMYGLAEGWTGLAVLGFAGGLLHLWNHALFKGLMFLGAGSLLHGAGTGRMDRMGGLLKRMPVTGTLLIGGSLAISALPPLNGLVGEWLIYLGLLKAGNLGGGLSGLLPLLLVGLLAVTGALAVVAFTRLAGVTLLGEPRSGAAADAREAPRAMILPMQFLLFGCLAVGLFPAGAARLLALPVASLAGTTGAEVHAELAPLVFLGRTAMAVWLGLALTGLLLVWIRHHRPMARAATWGCGFAFPSSRMAYTSAAYGELTRNHLLPAALRPDMTLPPVAENFPVSGRLEQVISDPMLDRVFVPCFRNLADRAARLRWLQQGKLSIYLFYIFVTCALLIFWSVLEGRG